MNAFNACSLNYVAIQGKLIQAVLLLLRALSHINIYDADGQNAVENHLAKQYVCQQETHKTIGHSRRKNRPQLSFQRTPTVNMLTGRSKQSNPQMCLQYREGDFSWKPCDSTLTTNRQNIGLDTKYNSNWDN